MCFIWVNFEPNLFPQYCQIAERRNFFSQKIIADHPWTVLFNSGFIKRRLNVYQDSLKMSTNDGRQLIAKARVTPLKTGNKYATVILLRPSAHTHTLSLTFRCAQVIVKWKFIHRHPFLLTFPLHINFQWNFFLFPLFTCSC